MGVRLEANGVRPSEYYRSFQGTDAIIPRIGEAEEMQTEHLSDPAGAPPAKRVYFFETANAPSPDAPRNIGADEDPFSRAFVTSLWEAALSELPSLFGRLVFLAGLREPDNTYRHYGLELALGPGAADIVRTSHETAFLDWLGLTIERQKEDLSVFLAGVPGHRRQALATWSDVARHAGLLPDSATAHERELYFADVQVVLGLCGADAPCGSILGLAENEA